MLSTVVLANPVLNNVSHGDVSISQTPTTTTVNQTSQQGIINWHSFNIGHGETTHFQQPAGGSTLNRINPNNGASNIYGTLTATGRIILVNPAGIYFGPNAYVNVGGMIASTLDITDQDFLSGNYRFSQVPGFDGTVINQGHLVAAAHGLVALVGGAVTNDGLIEAHMGQIVLASGSAVTMSFAGNELIHFAVDGASPSAKVTNTGVLIADGGKIMVSAKTTQVVLDNVINMEGYAQAKSVGLVKGELVISGSTNGIVRIAGKLDASGKNSGEKGGNITVTGKYILLDSLAELDVSGDSDAGHAWIGGNYKGAGPLQNAYRLVMADTAKIFADSITNGNGGEVILWSDDYTQVFGTVSAKGGALGGNGGFIETSGKEDLTVGDSFTANASATYGAAGNWLLDPQFLVVNNTGGSAYAAGTNNLFANNTAGTNTITSTSINAVAAATTVTLQANTDVTITTAIARTNTGSIVIQAGRDIIVNAGIASNNSLISLTANDSAATSANRTAGTGDITIGAVTINSGTAAMSLTIGSSVTAPFSPGAMTMNASGVLSFGGALTITGGKLSVTSTAGLGTTGTISVASGATLSLEWSGAGTLGNTGTISLVGSGVDTFGALQLNNGGTKVVNNPITLSSNATIGGSTVANGTFGGAITDGASTFNLTYKLTGSTYQMNAANSYSGTTTIDGGGIRINNAGGLSNGGGGTTSVINGGSLLIGCTGGCTLTNTANISLGGNGGNGGALQLGAGGVANTINNNITLTSNTTFGGGGSGTINGVITDGANSFSLSILAINPTNVILNSANTYDGGTTLTAGSLQINNVGGLGTGAVSVSGTGSLIFNTTGTLSNSAAMSLGGTGSGNGALRFIGAGTLTLSNTLTLSANTQINTVTGSTPVLNGTINGAFSFTYSGAGGTDTLTLGSAIGGTTALTSFTASSSPIRLNGGSVRTTGAQTYSALTLGANTTLTSLTSGDITFSSTVNSITINRDLTVTTANGNIAFTGAVGLTLPLTFLRATTGTAPNDISFGSTLAVSAVADTAISSSRNVSFANTLSSTAASVIYIRADNTGTGTGTVTFTTGNVTTVSGQVNIYYNPTTFGTQDTIYSGGTTPTKYMYIQTLGTATDASTVSSLGALSNPSNAAALIGSTKFYALAKNIDASATSSWNSGSGFQPIASSDSFDGLGYYISNLFINRSLTNNVGLFANISSSGTANIRNINLVNVNITGQTSVGGLFGTITTTGSLFNIYVSGTISSTSNNAGGIFGSNTAAISASALTNQASISASGSNTGGIGGSTSAGSFSSVVNLGAVTGSSVAGGVFGLMGGGNLSDSYSVGDISGTGTVGGLIGSNSGGTITRVYSKGLITSSGTSGGLVGTQSGTGSLTNSFWDTESSGYSAAFGSNTGGAFTATGGCYTGTSCANGGTALLFSTTAFTGAGWNFAADMSGTWTLLPGSTSPMLVAAEYKHNGSFSYFINKIFTIHSLQLIQNGSSAVARSYTLGYDINASGTQSLSDIWSTTTSNTRGGFQPIGTSGIQFTGSITGAYAVKNIYIHNDLSNGIGLFGYVGTTGRVQQIGVEGLITGATLTNAGGLVGINDGTLTNVYSTASLIATTGSVNLGSLVGANNGTISFAYGAGYISPGGSLTNVGGFAGNNTGSVSSSYWDTTTTGLGAVGAGSSSGMTGNSTANMMLQASYSGWDFTNIWKINSGTSYPYFLSSSSTNPPASSMYTVVIGSSLGAGVTVNVLINGAIAKSAVTVSGGNATFTFVTAQLSKTMAAIAYVSGNTTLGNFIFSGTDTIGTYSGASYAFSGTTSTVNVQTLTNGSLSNSAIVTARGGIVNTGLLFTGSGSNLDLTTVSGRSFSVSASSTYSLNGNITTAGGTGAITFNNPITVSANSTLTTTGGNIILNTVNSNSAGTNNLTLSSGAGSITFNGPIGTTTSLANFSATNTGGSNNLTLPATTTSTGITLSSGGTISQTGVLTTSTLTTTAANGILLDEGFTNVLNSFLATNTGGTNDIRLRNNSATLTIPVSAITQTGNGAVTISNSGNLTVASNITVSSALTAFVRLEARNANSLLTLSGNVNSPNGFQYNADNMTLTGTTTGSNSFTSVIAPYNSGVAINLGGADSAGVLGLTNAELNTITTGAVLVLVNSGANILISNPIAPAGVNTLSLSTNTTGTITQSAGATITATNLDLRSADSITLTQNNAITTLGAAVSNASATFSLTNTSPLNISSVYVANGLSTNNGNITLSTAALSLFANVNAGTGTVAITNTGAISQSGSTGITATNLSLSSSANVSLNQNNAVGTLAASISGSGNSFTFNNTSGALLTIGTVNSINGVATANGAISITNNFNLTVSNTTASNDVDAGTSTLALNTTGSNRVLTVNASAVVTASGGMTYTADNMTLTGTTAPGAGSLTLLATTAGTAIQVGGTAADAAGILGLSQAELSTINGTGSITIGNGSNTGGISVVGTLNTARDFTLTTGTTAAVSAIIGGTTPLSSLTVNATSGIALSANITTTGTQTYNNAITLGADVSLTSNTVGAINFNSTVDSSGSVRNLTVYTANGNINFVGAVGGTLQLATLKATSATAPNDVVFNSATNTLKLNGTGASVIQSGRNITFAGSVVNAAAGTLKLVADYTGTGTGTVTVTTGNITSSGGVSIYYNPITFGTQDTIYTGGTTPTKYMLINSIGTSSTDTTSRSFANLTNNTAWWADNFALAKDIDASITAITGTWNNGGLGFTPIGTSSTFYTGNFDGLGHVISNLYINQPTNDYVGLFGDISATISNIGLKNVNIVGRNNVGALVGNLEGTVNNSFSTGTVGNLTTTVVAGGLIGVMNGGAGVGNSHVNNSYSDATVFGQYAGGLVGTLYDGTVANSYSTGNVNALAAGSQGIAGGFIGWVDNTTTISKSYSSGSVSGFSTVGGFIGYLSGSSTISDVYSLGAVSASSLVGGFVGYGNATGTITITRAYSTGAVSGTTNVGGFAGALNGSASVTSSFWDTATSGQASSNGGLFGAATASITGGTFGSGAGQLANSATYSGAGWNIGTNPATNTWLIFAGTTRPMLAIEHGTISSVDYTSPGTRVSSAHGLQLIGLTTTTLAGTYTLIDDINASSSYRSADVWGSTKASGPGFIPIGSTSTHFTGSISGKFAVKDVYINLPAATNVGLFGFVDAVATVSTIGVSGTVNGLSNVGGLFGTNAGTVSNVYSIANITAGAGSNVGGLVGSNSGTISFAYSAGRVTSTGSNVGGFVGNNSNATAFSNNFYDTTTSAQASAGTGTITGITGNATAAMQTQSTYTGAGWDFTNIWKINAGTSYPYFVNSTFAPALTFSIVIGSSLTTGTGVHLLIGGVDSQTVLSVAGGNITFTINLSQLGLGTAAIAFVPGNTTAGNVIFSGTDTGGTYTGYTLTTNTINAYSLPNGTLDNGIIATARGAVADTGLLFTRTGNNLTLTAAKNFTVASGTNFTLNGNISGSAAGNITFNNATTFITTASTLTATGGIITANALFGNTTGALVFSGTTVNLNGAITVNSSLAVTGTTNLNGGSINTTGTQTYNSATLLGVDTTLTTGNSLITFANTLNSLTASLRNLTTNSGTGGITFTGIVGGGTFAPNDLIINNTGTTTFTAAVTAGSLTTDASGTTAINGGSITTTGAQTYNDNITTATNSTTLTGTNITAGAITRGAGLNLTVNTSGTSSITGVISNTGNLIKSGAGTLTLSAANTYTGTTTISAGTLSINSIGTTGTNTAVGNAASAISIGATGVLRYTGTGHSSSRVITLTASGGTIDASGSGALTLSGGVTGNTFNLVLTGTGAGTESGVIATTTGTVTKSGTGSWTLSNANTYTGATTITNGSLIATVVNAFGTGAAGISVTPSASATATLNLTGLSALIGNTGSITLNSSAASSSAVFSLANTYTFSRNITLTGAANNINVNGGGVITLSGVISNTGSLTAGGAGTIILSNAANSYSGGTILNAGTVSISSDAASGNAQLGVVPGSVTANSIQFGGGTLATTAGLTLAANRGMTLNTGGGTLAPSAGTTLAYSGIITGGDNLTINGGSSTAQVTLSGSNSYTGTTTITAGVLSINSIGNSGTNTAIGNTSGAINIGATGTLRYTGSGHSSVRPIVLTASGGTLDASGSGALTLSGGVTGNTFNLVLTGTGTATASGVIGTGTGTLTKSNTGSWTLSNTNTYSGLTTITGGTLVGTVTGAFGFGSAGINVTPSSTFSSTLDLTALSQTIDNAGNVALNNTSGVSTTLLLANTYSFGRNIVLTSTPNNINVSGGSNVTITGVVSGTGRLTAAGAGTLTLINSANSYSGGTTINAGILSIDSDAVSGNAELGVVPVSATANSIQFGGGTLTTTAGLTLAANRGITLNAGGGTINASSGTLIIGGTINGGNALSLGGAGTRITLNGVVGGTTPIASLTSNIANTISANITSTGTQTYNNAITLGNNVTFAAGSSAINFNGTIDGAFSLTANSTGATTFASAVGATTPVTTLTTNAGGSTSISANITTSAAGGQVYNDTVTIAGNTTLTANTSGALNFITTLNSGTLNNTVTLATSGATTFGGVVGAITPFGNLITDAGGTTAINGGTVHVAAAGTLVFNDPVTLGADTTFNINTGSVTFNNTLNSSGANRSFLINGNSGLATITFNGVVGGTLPLSSITTNNMGLGFTNINNNITTTGAQNYAGGPVALNADVILTTTSSGAISFGSTLNSFNSTPSSLTTSTGSGNVTFNAGVGTINRLNALTINNSGTTFFVNTVGSVLANSITTNAAGTTSIDNTYITTTGAQTYNDAVSVSNLVNLKSTSSGAITFNSTLVGATGGAGLNVTTANGNISFVGAIGSSGTLSYIRATASSANNDITFGSTVTFNGVGSTDIVFIAGRNITLANTMARTTSGSDIYLRADATGTGTGTVTVTTGNISTVGLAGIYIYYNPTTFGTQDTIYTGGTAPTKYMLVLSLGNSNDSATTRTLGALSNNTSLWASGKNYALAKDIDASTTSSWNSGAGFSPIGTLANPYQGGFDGLGYKITGLTINRPSTDYVGLFGLTNGSFVSIQNVNLINVNITGLNQVGAIVGESGNILINLYSSGTVNTGAGNKVGGIVGRLINNSRYLTSAVNVTGNSSSTNIGGLIGSLEQGGFSFNESSATGNVSGGTNVGGLIGINLASSMQDGYALGNVSGVTNVGGLIGQNNATFTRGYSTGAVTGTTAVGGLVGLNTASGTITQSFWDTDTSGRATGVGTNNGTVTNLTGGCFTGTCTNGGTANLSASSTYSSAPYSWNIGTSTLNLNTWLIINGQTRPMLGMEYFVNTNHDFNSTPSIRFSYFTAPIYTAHSLQLIRINSFTLGGSYTLGYDISASGTSNAADVWGTTTGNGRAGFMPIGNSIPFSSFSGSLTGGYAVTNIYINQPSGTDIGLFGYVGSTGSVQKVGVSGTVNGLTNVGGLIGTNAGTVSNVYSIAAVTAGNSATNVGGLVGTNLAGATISNAYSAGAVVVGSLPTGVGNFAGNNSGTFSNNFNDNQTSLQASSVGTGSGTGVTANNTSTMKTQSTFTSAGWDFTNIWKIDAGASYPYFIGSTFAPGNIPSLTITLSSSLTTGTSVSLLINGSVYTTVLSVAGGNVTFVVPLASLSTTQAAIAYVPGNAAPGNFIFSGTDTVATFSGAGYAFVGSSATVQTLTNGSLSNAALATARGTLNDNGLIYSASGNHLTLATGASFAVSGNTYTLNGNITTSGSGAITFNTPITLAANSVLTAGSGNITLNSTMDNNGSGPYDFNAGSSTGNMFINGNVGGTTRVRSFNVYLPGGIITITNNSFKATEYVRLESGTGPTQSGSLSLEADFGFILSGLNTNGGNLSLSGTFPGLNLYGDLIATGAAFTYVGNGYLILDGNIGSPGARLASFSNTGGIAEEYLNFGVYTTGAQTHQNIYIENTTTTATLSSTTGNISLKRINVQSDNFTNVVINAGSGAVTITPENIGSVSNRLASFAVTGSSILVSAAGNNIYTAGAQTYTGNITFSSDYNLIAGGAITFNGSVTGASVTLNLTATGLTTFANSVTLASLAKNGAGTTAINGGSISTNNVAGQTYAGAVTLGGATTLTATANGVVTFSGTVNGPQTLTINTSGVTTFGGAVGGSTALTSLTTDAGGSTAINGGSVITTGTQTYNDNITIANSAATLNGTNITAGAIDMSTLGLTVNTSGTSSITGIISGTNLTKAGSGTLTLSAANTYSGTTTINSGTLIINNNSGLGTSAATVNNAGTLSLLGTTRTINNALTFNTGSTLLDNNANGRNILSGTIALSGTNTINTASSTGILTLSGVISGSTTLSKTGAGMLTITNGNSYSGTTTLSAGILNLQNSTALGTSSATINTGTTLFLGAATLSIANGFTFQNNSTLLENNANGNNTLSGTIAVTGTLNLNTANATNDRLTLSGNLTGSSITINKTGVGTLILSGSKAYTGTTNIATGSVILSSNTGAGTSSVNVRASTTLNISGTGLSIANGINLFAGGTLLDANVTGGNTLSGTIALTGASTVNVGGSAANTLTLSGTISGTSITLNKTGAGTLLLTQNNSYSGTTNVNAGTLAISGNANAFGTSTVNVNALTTLSIAATLGANLTNTINMTNATLANTGTNTLSGTNLGLTGANFVNAAGTLTISKVISGTSSLEKLGSGTLILNATNLYSGATTLTSGTLTAGNAAAFSSGVLNLNGGTLNTNAAFTLGNSSFTVGGNVTISGSTNITLPTGVLNTGGQLTVTNSATTNFNGSISGAGSLIVNGGTVQMSAANSSFSGALTLTSGTLQVNSTNASPLGTGTLNLNGGTLLSNVANTIANPFILGGNTTLNGSSTLAFSGTGSFLSGNTLTVGHTGTVTFNSGLTGAGNLTLGSAGTVVFASNSPGLSGTITLNAGTASVTVTRGIGSATVIINPSATLSLTGVNLDSNRITMNGSSGFAATITSTGTSRLGGAITLGASSFNDYIIASSGTLVINNNINGNGDLYLLGNTIQGNLVSTVDLASAATGAMLINGEVGNTTALRSIHSNVAVTFGGTDNITEGDQFWSAANNITLIADAKFISLNGNVTINADINGHFPLTIKAADTITINGAIGAIDPTQLVTISAPTIILNGAQITSNGSQVYNGTIVNNNTVISTLASGSTINFLNSFIVPTIIAPTVVSLPTVTVTNNFAPQILMVGSNESVTPTFMPAVDVEMLGITRDFAPQKIILLQIEDEKKKWHVGSDAQMLISDNGMTPLSIFTTQASMLQAPNLPRSATTAVTTQQIVTSVKMAVKRAMMLSSLTVDVKQYMAPTVKKITVPLTGSPLAKGSVLHLRP